MTRWAKENPEMHPNGSSFALKNERLNPLRALVNRFSTAPEGTSKKVRKKTQKSANSLSNALEMTEKNEKNKPEKPSKKNDLQWTCHGIG